MKFSNTMHNNDVISELHAKAAQMQIERFSKQMPYGKYMCARGNYETNQCLGLGYTIGGEIVAIPDFVKFSEELGIYALYESSSFLRLDDGSLVGIMQGPLHDYLHPTSHINLDLGLIDSQLETIISGYNASICTRHPNWVIHTVGWFETIPR